MVGGTIRPAQSDSREIPESLVLTLSGEASGTLAPPRTTMPLTTPSLLSRATRQSVFRLFISSPPVLDSTGEHANCYATRDSDPQVSRMVVNTPGYYPKEKWKPPPASFRHSQYRPFLKACPDMNAEDRGDYFGQTNRPAVTPPAPPTTAPSSPPAAQQRGVSSACRMASVPNALRQKPDDRYQDEKLRESPRPSY